MQKNNGPFTSIQPVVLASGSPRRLELLSSIGIEVEVVPSSIVEPSPMADESPAEYAMRMACLKADDIAVKYADSVVIGSDTVVALGNRIMGKPESSEHAFDMLSSLSGNTHQVVTGCCVHLPGAESPVSFYASTDVVMRTSTEDELRAYIATGESVDKAGAYAIQGIGGFMVREISGSYTNVVGLPLARILDVLLDSETVAPRTV